MRVKILQSRAGDNVNYDAGQVYDIPDGRAQRWVASGFAVAVDEVVSAVATEEVVAEEPKRGRRR
ncbi:hypothetical protein IB276_26200 [Ensifer sp. ENS04]|uniref:hypothetical protein n=1 Tax=Ensifer sp. ENS04 TaxID=2769281 RepID=UPI00177D5075|nr:hypothetical protein [Ensifer sp. ENS04]MBD9542942.1 hypothetical protein [Ensifer sp. ENS04]